MYHKEHVPEAREEQAKRPELSDLGKKWQNHQAGSNGHRWSDVWPMLKQS